MSPSGTGRSPIARISQNRHGLSGWGEAPLDIAEGWPALVRLIKLKLTDYRRFAGEQSLDLNESVIALVGANEAGKSSILAAIDSVGRQQAPSRADTTRGLQNTAATVSTLFALDPEDRAALTGIHDGTNVDRFWIIRKADSTSAIWDLEPSPRRDLAPRKHCLELFEALKDDLVVGSDVYSEVAAALASAVDTLSDETIATFETLGTVLRETAEQETGVGPDQAEASEQVTTEEAARKQSRTAAASALVDQARVERQPNPWRQVVDALANRLPPVVSFSGPDRELLSTYRLDEVTADPPPALRNLCALAGLNLAEVQTAVAEGRVGHAERLFEVANAQLKDNFRGTWRQSTIYPRFGTALDQVLRIFIATEDGEYTAPEERSDGLRWFMALHAFLGARNQPDLILLVDEAETHLHYDAQADLVDALMNQRIARQVIYTTHSVGCLPPDLGCGIRVALAEADAERSRIANSYWSVNPTDDEKVGYTPLLFAMGARLLALTIPRFGIIVEGPSDAILLPSLLREAAGLSALPYRIAPGLSEIAKSNASSLPHHAGKVVALADGDQAGHEICAKLRESGVPSDSIFDLGHVRTGCTLEDLVDISVLAEAIDLEMQTWGIGPLRVAPADLPPVGRWAWLTEKGREAATPVERLSKPRVAQRIVDIGRDSKESSSPRSLVYAADIEKLRELHKRICAELGVEAGPRDLGAS